MWKKILTISPRIWQIPQSDPRNTERFLFPSWAELQSLCLHNSLSSCHLEEGGTKLAEVNAWHAAPECDSAWLTLWHPTLCTCFQHMCHDFGRASWNKNGNFSEEASQAWCASSQHIPRVVCSSLNHLFQISFDYRLTVGFWRNLHCWCCSYLPGASLHPSRPLFPPGAYVQGTAVWWDAAGWLSSPTKRRIHRAFWSHLMNI